MREVRIVRALAALICIALLVCAVGASGYNPGLAVFVLPFSFFLVFAVSPLPAFFRKPAAQPRSFLRLSISRAPSLA
jgi:hypothetical protein